MANITDAKRFLQAVFPDWATLGLFANLHPAAHTRDLEALDAERGCYWSIAAFPAEYRGTNIGDNALDTRALVIDDVGTKGPPEGLVELALGRPTAIVETSLGNFQWAYRLSRPVAKTDWGGFFGSVAALIGHVSPLDAPSAQTLMRLPMGRNTKPQNARFAVRLVELNDGVELDPDKIPRVAASASSSGRSSGGGGGWARDIEGLGALIPNNDDPYDLWEANGERFKAAGIDKDRAFRAFEAYSRKSSKHDDDDALRRWNSFKASKTSGKELLTIAAAADPEGFKAWQAAESAAAFGEDTPPPLPLPQQGAQGGAGGVYDTTHRDMADAITARLEGSAGWLDVDPMRWAMFKPAAGRWMIGSGAEYLDTAIRQETAWRTGFPTEDDLTTAKWHNGVFRLMRAEERLRLRADDFDANKDIVGTPAGVLTFDPLFGVVGRDGRAGDRVTKSTSVARGAAATASASATPVWDKFLGEFCGGDKSLADWWQVFSGYCLTGHVTEHALVFVYGPGGNGKSVFIDTISEVMGDYARRADHRLFMEKKGNMHLTALADLEGARLVTVPDVPDNAAWDMGLVKLVTGDGKVTANKMRQDVRSWGVMFKLVLAGNAMPRLDSVDEGVRRRMHLVPALLDLKAAGRRPDKHLREKLRAEGAGILDWMVRGLETWLAAGRVLPPCLAVTAATEEYLAGADVFGRWRDANLKKVTVAGARVTLEDAWRSWDAFRGGEGAGSTGPHSKQQFSTKLKDAGFAVAHGMNGAIIRGVELSPQSPIF